MPNARVIATTVAKLAAVAGLVAFTESAAFAVCFRSSMFTLDDPYPIGWFGALWVTPGVLLYLVAEKFGRSKYLAIGS